MWKYTRMKKEKIENKQVNTAPKAQPVNVHDDYLMVELGIRPKHVPEKDNTVWTKTASEKRALKVLKRSIKGDSHFHAIPIKPIPVRAKLIIYVEKGSFPKTTYSTECWQHEIYDILSKFTVKNKKTEVNEIKVIKFNYNGKNYKFGERPFWFFR